MPRRGKSKQVEGDAIIDCESCFVSLGKVAAGHSTKGRAYLPFLSRRRANRRGFFCKNRMCTRFGKGPSAHYKKVIKAAQA